MVLPSSAAGVLLRFVYVSTQTRPLSAGEMGQLVRVAGDRNWREGISGVLAVTLHHYVQWIEGPGPVVELLIARLRADRRHRDLQVVQHGTTSARAFNTWGLRLVPADSVRSSLATLSAARPLDGTALMHDLLSTEDIELTPLATRSPREVVLACTPARPEAES